MIKIEKLTFKDAAMVFGGAKTQDTSGGGTTGVPTDNTCDCCCPCGAEEPSS
jgi:hypothetical protein